MDLDRRGSIWPRSSSGRTSNVQTNVPNSDSDFYTWEVTGTKRFSNRWSLLASYAHTWVKEFSNGYFGNTVRQNNLLVTPNDLINTDGGRHEFTTWQAKLHGTWETPWWDIKMTPILRHQSGQPYGRTFQFGFNYGTQFVLAEPLGTRRQDNITLLDLRVEKVIRFGADVGLGVPRRLQHVQQQRRAEHHLEFRHVVPAPVEHRPAADCAVWGEVRMVSTGRSGRSGRDATF